SQGIKAWAGFIGFWVVSMPHYLYPWKITPHFSNDQINTALLRVRPRILGSAGTINTSSICDIDTLCVPTLNSVTYLRPLDITVAIERNKSIYAAVKPHRQIITGLTPPPGISKEIQQPFLAQISRTRSTVDVQIFYPLSLNVVNIGIGPYFVNSSIESVVV